MPGISGWHWGWPKLETENAMNIFLLSVGDSTTGVILTVSQVCTGQVLESGAGVGNPNPGTWLWDTVFLAPRINAWPGCSFSNQRKKTLVRSCCVGVFTCLYLCNLEMIISLSIQTCFGRSEGTLAFTSI